MRQRVRLLLALALALAPATLPAQPAPREAPPAERSADELAREVAQLEQLERGELPEGVALAQLFTLNLLNETEVADRRAEVEQALAEMPPLPAGADPPPARRIAELRLEILRKDVAFRQALVDADQRRLTAQREAEEAEAARQQAEEEARRAGEARVAALAAADAARSAAEKLYATELAKIESVRLDQAKARQRLAEQRGTLRSSEAEAAEEQIRTRVQQAAPGAPGNRALYEECVAALTRARARLGDALKAVDADVEMPRYVPPSTLPPEPADARARLLAAAAERARESELLEREVRRLRHDTAAAAYDRQQRLNHNRIDLLGKLAEEDRAEILGLGSVGLEQLRRELDHLGLQIAWYRHARANLGFVWASVTEDLSRLLKIVRDGVLFAILCVAAVWAARRRQRWLDQAAARVVHLVREEYPRRVALGVLGLVERVFPELLLVSVALLAPWALGRLAEVAEVILLLELFLLFAIYRLVIAASYLLIAWLSGGGVLGGRFRMLTLQSLRLGGLYVLVTLVILALSEEALGRGYLYSVVANIWWIGGLPIGAILVRWWQPDIVDAYLAYRGTGAMAAAVNATRERWFGFFVAVAAVAVLIVVAAARLAARFAMGFDQTRKALAFLFRRRLERAAEQQGEQVQPALDAGLLEVLSEQPASDPELLTPHFPDLEQFLGSARQWAEGGPAVPTLLVGDTGFGKTTWLQAAAAKLAETGLKVHLLTPQGQIASEAGLLKWLGAALKVDAGDATALTAALAARGSEVIMIDDGHQLFSRRLGGFEAWDALSRVAGTGATRALWLVALARFPYDYLVWARNGLTAPFRRAFKLKPWSDTEIAELLRTRMHAAGYRVRYDDLVVDRVEGVQRGSQLLRTETEYARLIWDYADGCPRTALRCWRLSLTPAGRKTVSVRLFRRPDVARLQKLSQRERFILAAVVWHQVLDPALAAAVLRFPEALCSDTLALLRDWKVVGEQGGAYRLESEWLQPVRRMLRRENLLVT